MSDAYPPKSVLIAGGSGGLGSAIARRLADHGNVLTLVARDADRLAAVPVAARRVALDLRAPGSAAEAVSKGRRPGCLRGSPPTRSPR